MHSFFPLPLFFFYKDHNTREHYGSRLTYIAQERALTAYKLRMTRLFSVSLILLKS